MEDTIAAISTPPGEGGIGIVRISGDNALKIAYTIFRSSKGKKVKIVPRKVHFGYIVDPETSEKIDEVILTYMKAPKSYTTQDVIEINCHGGPLILKRVLDLVLNYGSRLAEPGEFTKRAFLGGRIDLAQAEAVMDLIRSRTDDARKVAMSQMKGELSSKINQLRENLIDFMLQLEVRIDFCEDDIPPLEDSFKINKVEEILSEIDKILSTFNVGKIYREGLKACIVGPPNAGKSTLMNTLLGEDRAIVTPIPGTTRDRIEESINIDGVPVVLIDTAGIRKSDDPVEAIGVKKTIEAVEKADIVLLVLDASQEEMPPLADFISILHPEKTIVLMNKIDLEVKLPKQFIKGFFEANKIIEVSLLQRTNIDALKKAIVNMALEGKSYSPSQVILTNVRHRKALEKTKEHLLLAKKSIEEGMPDDFITIDLKSALDSLSEITGKVFYEDLMNRVFNNFCIGK